MEQIQILNLLYTFEDLTTLYRQQNMCSNTSSCTWNNTEGQQLKQLFLTQKAVTWDLLAQVEEFHAYVHYYEAKMSALESIKCKENEDVFDYLELVILRLTKGKAATLLNTTNINTMFDYFLDFVKEIREINVTLVQNQSTCSLTWQFDVTYELDSTTNSLSAMAGQFCRSLEAFVVAIFGVDIHGQVCNPTTAQNHTCGCHSMPPQLQVTSFTITTYTPWPGCENMVNSGNTTTGTPTNTENITNCAENTTTTGNMNTENTTTTGNMNTENTTNCENETTTTNMPQSESYQNPIPEAVTTDCDNSTTTAINNNTITADDTTITVNTAPNGGAVMRVGMSVVVAGVAAWLLLL